METRQIVHEEPFDRPPAEVFASLVTPSAVRQWWDADRAIIVARPGGTWAAAWGEREDDPDYVSTARIAEIDPPRRLVLAHIDYYASQGAPPFHAEFEIVFEVEARGPGCLLRVTQRGFPAGPIADGFYAGCERGWRDSFAGLRRYFDAAFGNDGPALA